MEDIIKFIEAKAISREMISNERVYITDEMKQHFDTSADFFYKEVIDPQLTIKMSDIKTALEMARQVGIQQGQELITIE